MKIKTDLICKLGYLQFPHYLIHNFIGSSPNIEFASTTHENFPFKLGSSYMVSSNVFSKIDLNPLAPVFCSIAFSAAASNAESVNSKKLHPFQKCLILFNKCIFRFG